MSFICEMFGTKSTEYRFVLYFRPMYCDNVDYHDPSGVQTVGRMLRDNLEPLLMVCIHYYEFNYVSYDI